MFVYCFVVVVVVVVFFFFGLLHKRLSLSHYHFFFVSSIHICPYLFISPFFSFFFSLIQEVLSFSLFFFTSSRSLFFFSFLPPYMFVLISLSPPSFLSFSPSFKRCSHSLSLSFFLSLSSSPSLSLFFFFFLLDSKIAIVFVKRVGGRGHYGKSVVREFSLQTFPPDLEGINLWARERK